MTLYCTRTATLHDRARLSSTSCCDYNVMLSITQRHALALAAPALDTIKWFRLSSKRKALASYASGLLTANRRRGESAPAPGSGGGTGGGDALITALVDEEAAALAVDEEEEASELREEVITHLLQSWVKDKTPMSKVRTIKIDCRSE